MIHLHIARSISQIDKKQKFQTNSEASAIARAELATPCVAVLTTYKKFMSLIFSYGSF